jgi:arylsulfatase A-like enzyme
MYGSASGRPRASERLGRGLLLLAAAAAAAVGAGCGSAVDTDWTVDEGTSLLLISVCSVRADHMSSYGYRRPTTPHLDRFAERAVVFDHAVSQWPKTAPAFASIVTGKYGHSTGVMRVTPGQHLADEHVTLAEVLRRRGFGTAALLTTAALNTSTNIAQGFDTVPELWVPEDRFERATDEAEQWLREHGDRPFFVWVHYNNAHWPYRAIPLDPEMFVDDAFYDDSRTVRVNDRVDAPLSAPGHPHRKQIERADIGGTRSTLGADPGRHEQLDYYVARYDAGVFAVDQMIGDLLGRLAALGLEDRTIVAVIGDHGEALGEHDYYFEHGRLPYDNCARVPLMIRLPGQARQLRVGTPVPASGLAATLLELLGAPLPAGMEIGSLMPALRGADPAPAVFSESGYQLDYTLSVRDRRWKLIHVPNPDDRRLMSGSEFELYDLGRDPGELDNVVAEHPEIAARLRDQLERWKRTWVDRAYRRSSDAGPEVDADTRERLRELGYLE